MRQVRPVLQRRLIIASATLLVIIVGMVGYMAIHAPTAKAGDTPIKLLLIHGFTDNCNAAFDQINTKGDPGSNATTTMTYLASHGWSSTNIDEVGYYSFEDGQCTHNLFDFATGTYPNDVKPCRANDPNASQGNINQSIDTLACELSWYIFDNYTASGQPVSILAHSMGGLIVRDAMTNAGHDPTFSPQLDVRHIVTVGTPHNGLAYLYFFNAQQAYPGNVEVAQMETGSPFFTRMQAAQAPQPPGTEGPQGTVGTFWALMGADVQCVTTGTDSQHAACEVNANSGPWPSGDTIVQGESAMAMNANYKVLYGVGQTHVPLYPTIYSADTSTEYSHEANTCPNIPGVSCLTAPFYLNDGSGGTVSAWNCTANCTTNIADFTGNGNGTAPHSLANIVALLGATVVTVLDTPTVVPTPSTAWCTDLYYASNWLTGLAGGSQIATTFTVHYAYANGACTVIYVQSIGQGNIYTAGTLRSDLFQCTASGCGNIVVGGPYGPPIPFHSGWYGATIQANQLLTVFTTNGGTTSYFCLQADGMYQQAGSSAQQFVWTPGAPGLCYPRMWPSTSAPSPTTPPVVSTPPSLDGWIDGANGLLVSGWACDDANGGATSSIDFYIDAPAGQSGSSYVGGTTATGNRPDLVTAGVCGSTPNHGYQFYARVPKGTHVIWAYNTVSSTNKLLNGSGSVIVDNSPSCPPTRCS